jgi:ABC-2 type transport system permease protein
MSPLIIFLMVPLFVVTIAIRQPASPIVAMLSWFPPFTPFLMILRAPLHPPLWELWLQTGLMAVFAGLALFLSVRVYRAGAVNGAGISQVFSWLGRKKA